MLTLVLVVLAVNGVFIWLSTYNKSTLVDREYKTKDRKTGTQFLSDLGSQQALAWQTTINRPGSITKDAPTRYDISVHDREGKPVSGEMIVEVYRGADASKDFAVPFTEASIGNYHGLINFPLKGYWELHIRIMRGGETFTVRTGRFMVSEAR